MIIVFIDHLNLGVWGWFQRESHRVTYVLSCIRADPGDIGGKAHRMDVVIMM